MNPKSELPGNTTETGLASATVNVTRTSANVDQPETVPGEYKNRPGFCALIVDDDVGSQKLLGFSVSMQPQITEIEYAESGEEAIAKAQAKTYDLIFLDALMEGMNGYETCAKLREIPEYQHTAIIMVTGLTSAMDQAKGILAGATTYITKPVQQVAFKQMITRELESLRYRRSRK